MDIFFLVLTIFFIVIAVDSWRKSRIFKGILAIMISIFLLIFCIGLTFMKDNNDMSYESMRDVNAIKYKDLLGKLIKNKDVASIIKLYGEDSNYARRIYVLDGLERALNKLSKEDSRYAEGISFLCKLIKIKDRIVDANFYNKITGIVYRLNKQNIISNYEVAVRKFMADYKPDHLKGSYKPKGNLIRIYDEGIRFSEAPFWGKTPKEVMEILNNSSIIFIKEKHVYVGDYVTENEYNERVSNEIAMKYMPSATRPYTTSGYAYSEGYRIDWEVYLIDWENKLVTAYTSLSGELPPATTTVSINPSVPIKTNIVNGAPPEKSLEAWLNDLPEK